MIIQIEIDCETVGELYTHLGVIRKEVRKVAKRDKLAVTDPLKPMEWQDDNCYGSHIVTIREDEMLQCPRPPGISV